MNIPRAGRVLVGQKLQTLVAVWRRPPGLYMQPNRLRHTRKFLGRIDKP